MHQNIVGFLKTHSGKKGQGMPVVRNPQFYFREGFCWTDVNSTYLKARLKGSGVFDVLSMSLFSLCTHIPDWYFVCLINSKWISYYVDNFINSTSHFQINDARQLPVVIPSEQILNIFEKLFIAALTVKNQLFSGEISPAEAHQELLSFQNDLDRVVEDLYLEI